MRWHFVDRIDELIPGQSATGRKGVAGSEDYFADHFPDFPVLPGVVQIEALAQLAGKLIEVTVYTEQKRWVWPILSMIRKAKFRQFVRPGDPLTLHVELDQLRAESAICKVRTEVDGRRCAEAQIVFVFNPQNLDTDEAQNLLETLERKNLSILWDGYNDWAAGPGAPAEV